MNVYEIYKLQICWKNMIIPTCIVFSEWSLEMPTIAFMKTFPISLGVLVCVTTRSWLVYSSGGLIIPSSSAKNIKHQETLKNKYSTITFKYSKSKLYIVTNCNKQTIVYSKLMKNPVVLVNSLDTPFNLIIP